MSLRWKILLLCLSVLFVPVYLLNRYALQFFDRFTRTALEEHLKDTAYMIGHAYRDLPPEARDGRVPSAVYQRFLSAAAGETETHMQIVWTNGVVVYDSAGASGVVTDVADRPEIREALAGGYSARARLTPDREFMYYYIARPIKNADRETLGVAYVVRHTAPIIAAINLMLANQRAATYLALGIAALLSLTLAMTLTSRLRRLARAAGRYARDGTADGLTVTGHDEIGELGRTLRQMADDLERRNTYNRDFVSTTIHELKTPLTALQGAAEVLRDHPDCDPETRTRFLGRISRQVLRLTRLVGELRELTRLDIAMLDEKKEPVDLAALLREVVSSVVETLPEPHAPVVPEMPDGPVAAHVIPRRMEQLLANLLENAARYTPPTGRITVSLAVDAEGLEIRVGDTGCGIARANLPRIFDRFFTTESRGTDTAYGSGLGLAIAQAIVQKHGGSIRCESEPGQGTVFTIRLPAG